MTAAIVTDALTMAWFLRQPGAGVPFHTDRGSRYASQAMGAKLIERGMTVSVSRNGDCRDNPPTKGFVNRLKNTHTHVTTSGTRADAMADSSQYIRSLYNCSRRHSTLRYRSPVQFLENEISEHAVS